MKLSTKVREHCYKWLTAVTVASMLLLPVSTLAETSAAAVSSDTSTTTSSTDTTTVAPITTDTTASTTTSTDISTTADTSSTTTSDTTVAPSTDTGTTTTSDTTVAPTTDTTNSSTSDTTTSVSTDTSGTSTSSGSTAVTSDTTGTASTDTTVAPSGTTSTDTQTVGDLVTPSSSTTTSTGSTTTTGSTSTTGTTTTTDTTSTTVPSLNTPAPQLTTDQPDYQPGQTATIFGKFFQALQSIILKIFGGSTSDGTYTESTQNITVDGQGSFTTTYQLDNVFRPLYTITASDAATGGALAQTTFTDSQPAAGLEQCHNNQGSASSPVFADCKDPSSPTNTWGGGNANSGNAVLTEGNSQNYRLILTSMPTTGPVTITIAQQYTKGGKMAYDFPTGPGNLGTATTPIGLAGVFPCDDNHGGLLVSPCDHQVPSLTTAGKLPISVIPSGIIPDATVSGETIAIQTAYFGTSETTPPTRSPQYMYVYGATPGAFGSYSFIGTAAQVASGDTELQWTFTITPTSPTVVVTWGAHISKSGNYGTKGTAVSISGSPYHTFLIGWTLGNLGQQDMQMASNAIVVPGTIVIVKNTVGGNGTFNYTATGNGVSNFAITTAGGPPGTGSNTFSGITAESNGGSRSFTETVPSGWSLATPSCAITTTGAGTSTFSSSATGVTVSNLGAGDTVTCTFANTLQQGNLTIVKNTTGGNGTFNYTVTGPTASTPSITTVSGTGSVGPTAVNTGTYSVAETVPTGWTLTSASCTSGGTLSSSTISGIPIAAGASVTCTFNNTKLGTIILQKNTVGGDGTFNFTTTGGGGFPASPSVTTTSGSGSQTYNNITPGSFSVSETVPAGWDLTSSSCTSGTPASFIVAAGGSVTCTFTNTKRGSITIVKNTVGGDGTFAYTSNFGVSSLTTASGTASQTVNNLVPGSGYSISETVPTGWDLTSATCTNGSIGTITVTAGQTTTCTFTNTKKGTIVLVKNTVGGDGTFNFTTTGGDGLPASPSVTTTSGTGSHTFSNITPGTYSFSETVPTGWDLTSSSCTSGTPASFTVPAGGSVTCTFTNTKRGAITVTKHTVGGDGTFSFTAGGDASYTNFGITTTSGTGTNTQTNIVPGTYSATETVPTGWDKTADTCASIVVTAGQTATCSVTNTKQGTVVLVKNTTGGDGTFNFSTTGGSNLPASPSLTTTSGTASQTYNNISTGSYSVSETVPAGWDLTSSTCTGQGNTPASFTVPAGGTVTCTFDNTKIPTLTVNKVLVPANDSGLFNLQIDSSTAGTGANVGNGGTTGAVQQTIGSHTVGETAGTSTSLSDYVSVISGACAADGSVTLAAGDNKVCTITNTRKGQLVIVKNTVGDNGTFSYTGTGGHGLPASFNITTTANTGSQSYEVNPGSYAVAENVPTNWVLDSASCDNGNLVSAITVNPSQTVTCTFTDRAQGKIKIVKNTLGGDDTFGYTVTGPTSSSQSITTTSDSGSVGPFTVTAGGYSVSESTVPAGWDLTSATCDSGTPASFTIGAGTTVTCTFTNTKRGTIKVVKATNPAGGTGFTFTGDAAGTIDDGQNITVSNLVPGTYTATESAKAGWDLTALSCDDGSSATPSTTNLGTGTATVQAGSG